MKRDPRLHGLSSDQHHALVLARTIRMAFDRAGAAGELNDVVLDAVAVRAPKGGA